MPFGMTNAPATFQRLINRLIANIDGCEASIDVIIYSNTRETHLGIMRKFFQRLHEASLMINLVKSEFGCGHVTYLGHIRWQGKVKPISAKMKETGHAFLRHGRLLLKILPKFLHCYSTPNRATTKEC
jgi:hypothetical protein